MHMVGQMVSERSGWDVDYGYGPIALPNAATDDWPAFWSERRLLAHTDAHSFGAYTTEPDWRERRPVYQPWPAIVHLRLFGGSYRGMVERLLREAGG